MTPKNAKGEKENRVPQDREPEAWDEEDLGLVWDEAEFRLIASQLRTERGTTPL